MMTYRTEDLTPGNASDWRKMNGDHQDGSLYHDLKWIHILERSFGLRQRCFMVYSEDRPVALCPFFEHSIRGIKGLSTLPESDLSYLIVEDPSDPEVIRSITHKTLEIVKEGRLGFIKMAFPNSNLLDSLSSIYSNDTYQMSPHTITGHMVLDLESRSPGDLWEHVFTHKDAQRKYIRRFEQAGFQVRETRSKSDLDRFYEHYSMNLNQKGATPYERSHFDDLFDEYPPEELRLTILEKGEEMAAGLMTIHCPSKGTAYIRYSAPNKDATNNYYRRANLPLYWEAVNNAYELGYRRICFGSTPQDPENRSYQIKAGFGCTYQQAYSGIVSTGLLFGMLYRSHKLIENVLGG